MPISYAGVPLSLEDPSHELKTWIEKTLSLEDLRLWGETAVADRIAPNDQAPQYGLPRYDWPAPPRMKLNTLWWPVTGATRWARGVFLASAEQMQAIWDATIDRSVPDDLILSDGRLDAQGNPISVTASMYMLPPRPVSPVGGGDDGTDPSLYLIPLVDARYFWQFSAVDDLSAVTTWIGLLAAINVAIPSTVTWAATTWPDPDPVEMLRSYENAATMLDAMAASVGCRVVCQLDGSVALQSASQADAATAENIKTIATLTPLAGGQEYFANTIPATIQVVFPFETPAYVSSIDMTDDAAVETAGLTALRDIIGKDAFQPDLTILSIVETTHVPPADHEAMDTLRNDIITGILGWLVGAYDYSWAGVASAWPLDGYDDYIWFHCGYQYSLEQRGDEIERPIFGPGDYACFTRVCSLPPNIVPHTVLLGGGGAPASYFQLLSDIDGDAYLAFANPGTFNTDTFKYEDPNVDELGVGIIAEAWTVVLSDTAGQLGAWIGDWLTAEDTGLTIDVTVDEEVMTFPVWKIVGRESKQQEYRGLLLEALEAGGTAAVTIYINTDARTTRNLILYPDDKWVLDLTQPFVLNDYLMAPDTPTQSVIEGAIATCTYYADEHLWYITGANCNPPGEEA